MKVKDKRQKRLWLDNNNIRYKLNVVGRRSEKGNFGDKGNILIDDQIECVQYFIDNGGVGVVYQGMSKTIKQLKNALNGEKINIPDNLKKSILNIIIIINELYTTNYKKVYNT